MRSDTDRMAKLTRHIAGGLSEIACVAAEAEMTCMANGAEEGQSLRVGLAVDELATNALTHGAGGGVDPDICIRLWIDSCAFRLEVSAMGPHFDPCMPRKRSEYPLGGGGRGLTMVSSFADELSYQREGGRNITTFTVRRLRPGDQG